MPFKVSQAGEILTPPSNWGALGFQGPAVWNLASQNGTNGAPTTGAPVTGTEPPLQPLETPTPMPTPATPTEADPFRFGTFRGLIDGQEQTLPMPDPSIPLDSRYPAPGTAVGEITGPERPAQRPAPPNDIYSYSRGIDWQYDPEQNDYYYTAGNGERVFYYGSGLADTDASRRPGNYGFKVRGPFTQAGAGHYPAERGFNQNTPAGISTAETPAQAEARRRTAARPIPGGGQPIQTTPDQADRTHQGTTNADRQSGGADLTVTYSPEGEPAAVHNFNFNADGSVSPPGVQADPALASFSSPIAVWPTPEEQMQAFNDYTSGRLYGAMA